MKHVVRNPLKLQLNHVIFVWFGQACPGMPNVLQNNKVPISPERFELFCLLVACSYTSTEGTVLSCSFSWLRPDISKVLQNDCRMILLDIHCSYKSVPFVVGIFRHGHSANQIAKYVKFKMLENYMSRHFSKHFCTTCRRQ